MCQRFHANERYTFRNGAIGWRNATPFDCLGPYAKVQACPVYGTDKVLTCYATGYADTYFSVPACTRIRGKYVTGFFTVEENCCVFNAHDRFQGLLTQ